MARGRGSQEALAGVAPPFALGEGWGLEIPHYRHATDTELGSWPVLVRWFDVAVRMYIYGKIGSFIYMEAMTFFSRFVPDTTSLQLDSWHLDDAATLLTLHVTSAQRVAPCPVCAVFAPHVYSRYERILADLPWGVVRVRWQLRVRKYFCANVQCPPVSSRNGSLAWWLLGLGGHSAW